MRKFSVLLVICLLTISFVPRAAWADTTYNINFTVGAGSVTGTIQTDGATGTLASSDITDWNLLLNDGVSTFDLFGPLSGGNSAMEVVGSSFSATASSLLFDFSNPAGGFVAFQNPVIGSGINFLCFDGSSGDCSINPSTINLATALGAANIQLVAESGVQAVATATTGGGGGGGTTGAPEPGSLLLLLVGIVALGFARGDTKLRQVASFS